LSAEQDYLEICGDIEMVKSEAEKYKGAETRLSKTINEACLKLKMKLDSPKFDEGYRKERREKLIEIDRILATLLSKIEQ